MNDEPNLRKLWAEAAATQQRYVEEGEEVQLAKMRDGYNGLRNLGWRDATYCPKDGTRFLVSSKTPQRRSAIHDHSLYRWFW